MLTVESTKEKIAYLRGLLDGSAVLDEEGTRKVMVKLLDILELVANDVDELAFDQQEMENYLEAVDEDLNELEENIDHDEHHHCHCHDDDDDDMIEMDCPACGETVTFEEDLIYEEADITINCPNCGAVLFDSADFDDDNDDEDDDDDEFDDDQFDPDDDEDR